MSDQADRAEQVARDVPNPELAAFVAWWNSAPHRLKYPADHPAHLAAWEAWEGGRTLVRAALSPEERAAPEVGAVWTYFGCHREPGHFLFREGMQRFWSPRDGRDLARFDGMLPPQDSNDPYIATITRLGGWDLTALAFWDYSVDKRGGCNSVVFASSLSIKPDDMLAEAQRRFPQVFGRLPQPVRLKT